MKSKASTRGPARAPDVTELDFNDDRIPPRAGEPMNGEERRSMLPRRRVQQVGLTGAAVRDDVTADDLSPETLIDEDSPESTVRGRRAATDTVLRPLSDEEMRADASEDHDTDGRG